MSGRFGWCFLGCGSIAKRVLADLPRTDGGYLAAAWSQNPANAEALAAKYGGRAFARMEDAILDPAVQAVYVATPHVTHCALTLRALELGRPVLCEKPFAMNAGEALRMQQAARDRGLFLMEGMWTRFNPAVQKVLEWVLEERIGRVWSLEASFCSRPAREIRRVFDPALGGGSLLDTGVYPMALAQFLFAQSPEAVHASAHMGPTGVDALCAVLLRYPGGAIARLFSSIEVRAPHDAVILGEKGRIHLPKFWAPQRAELHTEVESGVFEARFEGEGFQFEFDAAMADIRAGRHENALLPHGETLARMQLLDTVREQIGLRYPGE